MCISRSATMAARHSLRRGASTTWTATRARHRTTAARRDCPGRAQRGHSRSFWSKRDTGPSKHAATSSACRAPPTAAARSLLRGSRTIRSCRGARGWESLDCGIRRRRCTQSGSTAATPRGKWPRRREHSGMAHKGQPPQDIYHGTIGADGRMTESLIAAGVCFCCKTDASRSMRAVRCTRRGATSFREACVISHLPNRRTAGVQFDPLVRVSEDKWELNGCPEDGPTLAVDQAGVIHIAWATVVNDGEPQKALFYATSRDGKDVLAARAVCPFPPRRRRDIHSWRSRPMAAPPLRGMRWSPGCGVCRSRASRAPASSVTADSER